jgi:hypothetical protein
MEWLTPLTALYAAAATVPALILLYFLKLKRRETLISSTLLWKRAIQDLRVNAPFQRIRRNLLLLLQLLALVAVLAALGGPVLSLTAGPARRYVLLMDHSVSMNAREKDGTRLELACQQARHFIDSLRDRNFFSLQDNSDQAMIIAFDDHARVMCNFTSDKPQLFAAMEGVKPTDGGSALSEAVAMAQAFAQSAADEAGNQNVRNPTRLIVLSDGRIRDLDQIGLGTDEWEYHRIGEANRNIAVVALQARRSYENPDMLNVYARLANYGSESITADVQLSIDGNVKSIRPVTLPAANRQAKDGKSPAGEVSLNFSLTHPEAGILEVRQLQADSLPDDDAAWTILPRPREISVLMVSGGNQVLESALAACPQTRFQRCSPAEFAAMDRSAWSVERPYDVIVLDNTMPEQLPEGGYLVFGQVPPGLEASISGKLENQVMIDWRARHPVLQYVNLANFFAAQSVRFSLPRDAEVLAEFQDSAAIAVVRRRTSTFLLVGFDVLQTNWPFEPGFILFCFNAIGFLAGESQQGQRNDVQVGQPIVVEGLPSPVAAVIECPGGDRQPLEATPSGTIRFAGTDQAGIYRLTIGNQPERNYAVNFLNAPESDIEPAGRLALAGQALEAQDRPFARGNLPVWPWLALLAAGLVCVEWIVYTYRNKI